MTLAPPRVAVPSRSTGSRFVFPILAVGGVFQAILQTVMVPLLPSMPALTGASITAASWLITTTLLVGAVVTPIFGRLADMYGKKRMLIASFALMTVGSLVCATTSDITLLIGARALQGAGAAVIPIGISILRDELPPHRVNRAVATMSSTLGLGTALGLPFAASIAEYANWHTVFWVTSGLGLALIAATALFIRESPVRTGGRFDGVGAVGLTAALVSLLVPVTQGSTWGWTSPAVLSMVAVSVLLFGIWGFQQLHTRNSLVDLRTSARRAVLIPHAVAMFVGFAFYGNALITTQLLQAPADGSAGYGLTIFQAALCQLPLSLSMIVFSQVGASISERRSPKLTVLVGALALVAGYGIHAVPDKPLWLVVTALGVAATGTALVYSTLPLLLLPAVPQTQMAAANGVNVLLRSVGTTMCSAVVATILAATAATTAGFTLAYLVCAVLAVTVFVVSLALPGGGVRRETAVVSVE
ncbi:MFS transporter [Rhodococcus triatomae]|uniref:Major Facilitator Superfamily protein n=1 Tax=Rhodococcus triatomae TaxID=300028 RepID=A0A1G8IC56_9NOCA|nr:MFS transporter [Rhodococcus triatomae]QNG21014.1 MFS transporter [Rhodococcus triatomae]QNG23071.1 MFS transporter [Rhodococcus triatomae]SDI16432.1 Major Facilitator Superfamily protein [Rhodococcus triatomae]